MIVVHEVSLFYRKRSDQSLLVTEGHTMVYFGGNSGSVVKKIFGKMTAQNFAIKYFQLKKIRTEANVLAHRNLPFYKLKAIK